MAVMSLDADDGAMILVVVRLIPYEAYASKDQKHAGFVKAGEFLPSEKGEPLTEHEGGMVVRTVFALRNALENIHG